MFPKMGDGNTTYHRAQRAAMFAYLDIVIARYSAQTDFWSMVRLRLVCIEKYVHLFLI